MRTVLPGSSHRRAIYFWKQDSQTRRRTPKRLVGVQLCTLYLLQICQIQVRIQDLMKGGGRNFTEACSADQSARGAEKRFSPSFSRLSGWTVVAPLWFAPQVPDVICARIDAAYACRETSSGYRLSGHVHGQGRTSTIDSGGMPPTWKLTLVARCSENNSERIADM